jgi:hypothetical protein
MSWDVALAYAGAVAAIVGSIVVAIWMTEEPTAKETVSKLLSFRRRRR